MVSSKSFTCKLGREQHLIILESKNQLISWKGYWNNAPLSPRLYGDFKKKNNHVTRYQLILKLFVIKTIHFSCESVDRVVKSLVYETCRVTMVLYAESMRERDGQL
uniref:Uncharacterized protein n=1 Tax=Pararge aegeria TaxID=116150 RepID=S4P7A2_9NEOP